MESGAPAAASAGGPAPGTSIPTSSTGAEAPSTDGDTLTDTGDLPIPVAPYAIVRQSRRYCFNKAAEDCRR